MPATSLIIWVMTKVTDPIEVWTLTVVSCAELLLSKPPPYFDGV